MAGLPCCAHLVERRPDADGETGEEAGAHGGGLGVARHLDGSARRIGEGLDEGGIAAHPAVDPQGLGRQSGVAFGGIDEIGPTVRHSLEDRSHDLRAPEPRVMPSIVPRAP